MLFMGGSTLASIAISANSGNAKSTKAFNAGLLLQIPANNDLSTVVTGVEGEVAGDGNPLLPRTAPRHRSPGRTAE